MASRLPLNVPHTRLWRTVLRGVRLWSPPSHRGGMKGATIRNFDLKFRAVHAPCKQKSLICRLFYATLLPSLNDSSGPAKRIGSWALRWGSSEYWCRHSGPNSLASPCALASGFCVFSGMFVRYCDMPTACSIRRRIVL